MSTIPSVLVVDDEVDISILFSKFLVESGFESTPFTDAQQAFDHFSQNINKYSLVIVDLMMPVFDGLTLAKKFKELNPEVKFILLTSYPDHDKIQNIIFDEYNIVSVLEKPIRLKELGLHVQKILSNTH